MCSENVRSLFFVVSFASVHVCLKTSLGELVWQEDFGTFTSDSTYWCWNYSDMKNPKKVEYETKDKWVTDYGLNYQHLKYNPDPMYDGFFTVAANVTDSYSGQKQGTQWDFSSMMGNGKTPSGNGYPFYPDHTYGTDEYGGMLFCNLLKSDENVLFSRRVSGLSAGAYRVSCYFNSFIGNGKTLSAYLRVTDLSSGEVVKSVVALKNTNELCWQNVKCDLDLVGDALLIEVIYNATGDSPSSDYVLDDIQLWSLSVSSIGGATTKSDAWLVYVDEGVLNVFEPEAGIVKVMDVCGNLVGVFSVEAGATSEITLPAGVYFVTLNAEVKKVLVY